MNSAPPTRSSPVRVAGRRPALPNRRAVVGGLLVATAAVGTFAAWSTAADGPSSRFLVAARDLPLGHVVVADDVEAAAMDLPVAVADRAFTPSAQVVGRRTVAPVTEGELLQRSAVVVPGDVAPARQLSFAIDAADALAGTLQEGEAVDVLVTFGGDAGATTEVAAAGARVARLTGGADGGRLVVLLSLPDDTDVLALATAVRRGDLTLVRSGGSGGSGG